MTNAERQARWKKRHEAKLARKAGRRGGHTPTTWESWDALRPTPEDFGLVAADEVTP